MWDPKGVLHEVAAARKAQFECPQEEGPHRYRGQEGRGELIREFDPRWRRSS